MPIRSHMSSIVGQIDSEHPELFANELGKIAEQDFVYTLSSTNINQSAPNLVKLYVTIRSRMSSIIDLIGPELSISTKLGHNTYVYKVSNEFNYGTNRTRTSGVICP